MNPARRLYDIVTPAPNGLRRGYTTGTCATAAVKAALGLLLRGRYATQVEVTLPDRDFYLPISVSVIDWSAPTTAHAEVIKDGGDDPDNTHGATLFTDVRINHCGQLRFFAGPGVGTVTLPGLRVAVGEPAINPVPRQMIAQAVAEVLDGEPDPGFDVSIGCLNGEAIARKTFNPRLGIVGGISILGTSGIVEPMSLAAWMASIEVYVRVALAGALAHTPPAAGSDAPADARPNEAADAPAAIAFTPGKIGRTYAREVLALPTAQVVQVANFVGASLDYAQQSLLETGQRLPVLWVLGHPGKIAKILTGAWDTHSGKSDMAMAAVAAVAAELGGAAAIAPTQIKQMERANTVENIVQIMLGHPASALLWRTIEQRTGALMHARIPAAERVEVRLFDMAGSPLGAAA